MPDVGDLDTALDAALALQQAGDLDGAEAAYRAILAADPDEPDALNLLGLILQERGQTAESIALLTRALSVDPEFPEALTNLARVRRFIGQAAQAAEAAQQAVDLDPDLAEAHLQLGHARLDCNDAPGAVTALRTATTLAPDAPDAWLHLGVALLRTEDPDAAAEALATAHRLSPQRVDVLVNLGVAMVSLGRLDEACCWHEQAVALAPDDTVALTALAVTHRRRQQPAESAELCRRVLARSPDNVSVLLLLAANAASLGDFAEAEACCRQVLALAPDSVEAQRELSMLGRSPDDAAAQQRLMADLADPTKSLSDRAAAGFALGNSLDRLGRYDDAFTAYKAANELTRIKQAADGSKPNDLRDYVNWAVGSFDRALFSQCAPIGDPSELPVFIVGMPRSGTTLVEQIVASHPDVFGAGERKDIAELVHTLGAGMSSCAPSDWDAALARRLAHAHIHHLAASGGGALRVTDKLPDNFQFLGQIAALFPNARVIICRRDMRDVCLSAYFQQFGDGMRWTHSQVDLAARAQDYERLMRHWRAVLPLRMLEVDYEALVADLEGEARRLIGFLGLAWDPACLAFHETRRPIMTASYWQVRQPLYGSSVGRWRHYARHLVPLFGGLAGLIPADEAPDMAALVADPVAALDIAGLHHRAGRLALAEPIYRALFRRTPDDPSVLHLLGLLLIDTGQASEAIGLIDRALALRPDTPTALSDLARAHRAVGDADAAVQAARAAIALAPGLADAWVQFGCALLQQGDPAAAAEALRRAVAMTPQSLEANASLAVALARSNDHAEAAAAWEAALALKRDDPGLLLDYASSLGALERHDEMLAVCRRAATLIPGDPRAQYGIAWALLRLGRGAEAAAVCRDALGQTRDSVMLWLLLGTCESTLGRFAAAGEAYRQVLALDPGSAEALNGLVAAGEGLDAQAAKDSQALLHDPASPVLARIAAGFSLGHTLDRSGSYDQAFAAFATANALLREHRASRGHVFDRDAFVGLVNQQIATIKPATFAATAGWGDASELPVFIVGMPRSGTSLVEQIVGTHPDVFGAGELKDVLSMLTALSGAQVLCAPTLWNQASVRRETVSHLERLRMIGGDAVRVVDKLPDNILCLGQIAALFPNARVILCRRDLRDTCLSCFFQYFRDDSIMWTDDLADCGFRAAQTERLMAHWANVLPIRMLEIQYETLVANLEVESRRLIDFLGLPWDPACLAFHETERPVLTASHWQVRQPLYASSVGRWRHYRRHLGPLLRELGDLVPQDGEDTAAPPPA